MERLQRHPIRIQQVAVWNRLARFFRKIEEDIGVPKMIKTKGKNKCNEKGNITEDARRWFAKDPSRTRAITFQKIPKTAGSTSEHE